MAKRILAVDDSATFRKVLGHSLREGGYEVTEAQDGSSALKILEETPVDIVITDLTMPGMDGIELVRKIKSQGRYEDLPVILLSTVSEKEVLERGREAGAAGWIVKPFEPEELISVVEQLT